MSVTPRASRRSATHLPLSLPDLELVALDLAGRTCLVTGGRSGLGAHLADALLDAGAGTVWVTSRQQELEGQAVGRPGLRPLQMDVTDDGSIQAAAERVDGVSVLVNNAGAFEGADLLRGDAAAVRREMEVNALGPLWVTRAFAPMLTAHESSAVLNVLSLLSWNTNGDGYSLSKAAAWGLTNGLRGSLAADGVLVTALHVGFMDTQMVAGFDVPKHDPRDVARAAVDGLRTDLHEVLFDEACRAAKSRLAGDPAGLLPSG